MEEITAAKEHTKELQAKKGRASYLGERSIGHIDPVLLPALFCSKRYYLILTRKKQLT